MFRFIFICFVKGSFHVLYTICLYYNICIQQLTRFVCTLVGTVNRWSGIAARLMNIEMKSARLHIQKVDQIKLCFVLDVIPPAPHNSRQPLPEPFAPLATTYAQTTTLALARCKSIPSPFSTYKKRESTH